MAAAVANEVNLVAIQTSCPTAADCVLSTHLLLNTHRALRLAITLRLVRLGGSEVGCGAGSELDPSRVISMTGSRADI